VFVATTRHKGVASLSYGIAERPYGRSFLSGPSRAKAPVITDRGLLIFRKASYPAF
jgi:hypothetical protein